LPSIDKNAEVIRFLGVRFRFSLVGLHHLYVGLLLLLIAWLSSLTGCAPSVSWFLYGIGLILAIDDILQHWIQASNKYYQSPVHVVVCSLFYDVPWIKRVSLWLDRLFGA